MMQHLRLTLCVIMTAACGGGDLPGGGDGDTDGGGSNTVNLIEAIPGRWRVVRMAGQPPPNGVPMEDDVRVDPDDPDCRQRIVEVRDVLNFPPGGDLTGGPPGDACVVSDNMFIALILDGTSVRFDAREPLGINGEIIRIHQEGVVRDDGTWMEYWEYNHAFNPPDRALIELEKTR